MKQIVMLEDRMLLTLLEGMYFRQISECSLYHLFRVDYKGSSRSNQRWIEKTEFGLVSVSKICNREGNQSGVRCCHLSGSGPDMVELTSWLLREWTGRDSRNTGNVKAITNVGNQNTNEAGQNCNGNKYGMQHYGNCPIKCNKCRKIGHKARECWSKVVATGANAQPIMTCYGCGEKGHIKDNCPAKNNPGGSGASGQAYALRDGDQNLGTKMWTVLRCTKKRTLVVKGDDGVSRLKVVSCMKVRKYVDRGSYLFVAQVVEKEPAERRLEDVPVICEFPDVFPEDLPGLPPSRQVEFKIELVPGAAPVARAPYRLAPSEMKELARQLQELRNKGFIRTDFLHRGELGIVCNEEGFGSFRMFMHRTNSELNTIDNSRIVIPSPGVFTVDPGKVEPNQEAYEWGEEEEEAFQLLKGKLCSAPILALPEGSEDFVVYCDASLKGYGAVLMQREKDWKGRKALRVRSLRGLQYTGRINANKFLKLRLTNSLAHFLPMKKTDSIEKLAQLYLKEIVCRHGVPEFGAPVAATSWNCRGSFVELIKHFPSLLNLKKCFVNDDVVIPLDEVQLDNKLHFVEEPVEIMDREVKRLKQSRILIIKVRWNSRRGPEFTWSVRRLFRSKYPSSFARRRACKA
ncbi:putative reverse transcriptase domain-containing protein [Tanacetum coccineum]